MFNLAQRLSFSILLLLSPIFTVSGYSQISTVDGEIHERTAEVGETYEGVFFIKNTSEKPAQLKIYQTSYQAFSELGDREPTNLIKLQGSNSDWIIFKPRGIVIRPRATIGVNYEISVPGALEGERQSGTYGSTIVIEEINQDRESHRNGRLGVTLLTHIGSNSDNFSTPIIGGMVKGRVIDEDSQQGVPDVILQINDVIAVSDKRGNFIFDLLKPGTYNFQIKKSSIPENKVTTEKNPRRLAVLDGKVTWLKVGLSKAATLSGQIMIHPFAKDSQSFQFASANDASASQEAEELIKGFGLGKALVELSNGIEIRRRLTDDEGRFTFAELPQGRWVVSIKDRYLPTEHHVDERTAEIDVMAGKQNNSLIRVLPGAGKPKPKRKPSVLLAETSSPTKIVQKPKAEGSHLPKGKKRLVNTTTILDQDDNADRENKYYTVRSGDWLSKIAQKFYGDSSRYLVIFAANRVLLNDPNLIYPGQKLLIPQVMDKYYTVRYGDWLSKIAQRFYGDPMVFKKLFAMNRDVIQDPNRIFPGQKIKLPVSSDGNYIVKKNDSLSKIAANVFKDAKKYPAIIKANEKAIDDPDLIYPGQALQIPKVQEVEPEPHQ